MKKKKVFKTNSIEEKKSLTTHSKSLNNKNSSEYGKGHLVSLSMENFKNKQTVKVANHTEDKDNSSKHFF
jgi:hypothetical protein